MARYFWIGTFKLDNVNLRAASLIPLDGTPPKPVIQAAITGLQTTASEYYFSDTQVTSTSLFHAVELTGSPEAREMQSWDLIAGFAPDSSTTFVVA
jgi:hypothetical protein